MPDYTPDPKATGDTFTAADWTEATNELEEQELKDVAQDAAIAALDAEVGVSVTIAESTVGNPINLLNQDYPANAIGFRLNIIMPGVGGGSGRRGAAGTVRNGGGAGPGGGMTVGLFVPKPAGAAKWHANIPSPGLGGAAVTADNTNGNAGSTPQGAQNGGSYGRVWITDAGGAVLWQHWLYPGGVGLGGTAAAMASVGGGFGLGFTGSSATAPGNGVANSTSGPNGAGACAGGAGGAISATDTPFNGQPGGWATASNVAVPTAGVVGGALPNAGGASVTGPALKYAGLPGNGGSGGAASVTGPAQAGADAIAYGGGGGGGGASVNGQPSGKGGNGGPGWLSVEMVYA